MKIATSPAPLFSPRDALIFLSVYLLSLAFCIAVPRALAFLPSSVALLGLVYIAITQRTLPCFDKKLLGVFGAFTVLACASALWSPDPDHALSKALKSSLLLFSTIIPVMAARAIPYDTACKNKFITVAALLCACAGGIIALEYSTDFYLARIFMGIEGTEWPASIKYGFLMNRSSVFLVLLTFPVALMLRTSVIETRRKNILTALVMLGVGAMLVKTNSQTAQIAALLSIPMLAFPAHMKKARRAVLVAVLVAMACAPFVIAPLQGALSSIDVYDEPAGFMHAASIPHRLEVWKFITEQIMQKPVMGHGIESTRHLRAGYIMPHMQADHVLHPHNATLQVWLEFGIVGILLFGAFVAFLLLKLDSMPRILQRYYMVLFIVLLGILSMGYGLWQAWLIGMIQTIITTGLIATRLNGLEQRL